MTDIVGTVVNLPVTQEGGAMRTVGMFMKNDNEIKPHIRKIHNFWVCYSAWDTIPCTADSPEKAYYRWLVKNQLHLEKDRQNAV